MEKTPLEQSRWWDWAAVGLLFLLMQTLASRLAATTWTPFLNLVQSLTYIGFIVGLALGYSRFSRGTVRLLNFFYMLFMLPLQWTLIIEQSVSLEEKLLSVEGRLLFSMTQFVLRRPVEDPLFFVAAMSFAFWIISSWAGFALVRDQNYLSAVLPAAIGLLIIQNYDNSSTSRLWFLAFFTFIALLLLGRIQFLQNRSSWRDRRIFLAPDTNFDLTSSMAIAAGLIILIAWTTPASVASWKSAAQKWNEFTKPWREFSHEMENAVSALESKGNVRRSEFYFGSQLSLGRGFPNSEDVVFIARAPNNLPPDQQPPRYYWRGRVYDYFNNGGWSTSGTTQEEFSPFAEQRPSLLPGAKDLARFSFQTGDGKISLLYGPSQPVWFSRPGTRQVELIASDDQEVLSWNASPEILPGETYQVDAQVKNPNRQQLREAGADYPEAMKQKYLQLPVNFSPRIAQLAKEITASEETPYDKTVAITNYLRQNIKYSATIAQPPANRDPLEWVLFDYKQAYCVYYATSEVLMLRSVGIPARMAVGFTQGTPLTVQGPFDEQERALSNAYEVLRNNAHAWPEVYFPGIGWVEFEPTAGQSPLERPLAPQEQDNTNTTDPRNPLLQEDGDAAVNRDQAEQPASTVSQNKALLYTLYLLPLLATAVALTIYLNRRFTLSLRIPVFLHASIERTGGEAPAWLLRWEEWGKLSPLEKAFESINFGLRQLDRPAPVHSTPIERAEKLSRILPEKSDQIKILLDEHQTSLYTSGVGDVTPARHAAQDIRRQVIKERIRYLFFGKPS